MRTQVRCTPTSDLASHTERLVIFNAWLHLLQRQAIDTAAIIPPMDDLRQATDADDLPRAYAAIDACFAVCENLQAAKPRLDQLDPEPGTVQPTTIDADWPGYGGDGNHRASTAADGPTAGRRSWQAPAGLAWYAAPVIVDGRVYTAAPGLRTLAWCLDLDSGAVQWRTQRHWQGPRLGKSSIVPQSYTREAAASTPVVTDDAVVIAELGAQGLEQGRRHLLWIDRHSGELRDKQAVDEADYRLGSVPLAGNHRCVVAPSGTQRIEPFPPQISPQDHLVGLDPHAMQELWRIRVGPMLSRPAVDDHRAYIGTIEGSVFAITLAASTASIRDFGLTEHGRLAWQQAIGAGCGPATLIGDLLLIGGNDGRVWALSSTDGSVQWCQQVCEPEPRSQILFSAPTAAADRLVIGTAHGRVHCLSLATGSEHWQAEASDWVRAAPVIADDLMIVAGLDGGVTAIRDQGDHGETVWQVRHGDHEVLADPAIADGKVLYTDGRLWLRCLDLADGSLRWDHPLLAHATIDGRRIPSDEMACGGWYQSKPTAANGTVYVGTPSRFVIAVDAMTGERRWRSEFSGAVSGTPTVAGDLVLSGNQGGIGEFRGLDAATGHPRWQQQLGWVWSSATVSKGRAFIPGCDGHLNCLDVATGAILWRHKSGAAAHPEAPVDDGRVFFGSWDHFVYAFDCASGVMCWQFHCGGTPDSGAPIAADGHLFVPMGGKRVVCLDAATGQERWSYRPDEGCMNGSPALRGERLYISTSVRSSAIPPASRIRCLDIATGTEYWAVSGGGITAPVIAGDHLYTACTSDNTFSCYALDGDSEPNCRWRISMGDRVYESVPAIHRGQAYILCEDGYLHAFA